MNTLQHSVVHRLPQSYRWGAGPTGSSVEPLLVNNLSAEDDLIGLTLLSHAGEQAREIMRMIQDALAEIQIECAVVECAGEPCLFVTRQDESATTCRLKNFGVGIAEPFLNASA
ncbi:YejG family protein [Erwinia sp. P7711]|uniref:YejG family protein n=1 Tax=Erwinia sp. P7711 TaxID=3141451 RepID=UPI003189E216